MILGNAVEAGLHVSAGDDVERAFAEWLSSQSAGKKKTDRNAELIVGTLWPLVQQGRLATRHPKLVALADKMARTAWGLLMKKERAAAAN